MTTLVDFVGSLPRNWQVLPIYAKGVQMPPDRNGNVSTSDGKVPIQRWKRSRITPSQAAGIIKSQPDSFKAVGVRTGKYSNGLVVLDVDKNLSTLKRGWTGLEGAPFVESGRRNAGKYLFYVPGGMWDQVTDLSHTATDGKGYEVLWDRQAVIFGAYGGGGEYKFQGDINSIPEAPAWLLAEMKDGLRRKEESRKTATDLLDRRSREEKIQVVKVCLSAIPHESCEDQWVRIGMMIHSSLPDEAGLDLWRQWSKEDPEYSQDWENGNDPCAERWNAGFNAGRGLTLGSLLYLAKEADPKGIRFKSEDGKAVKSWVMRIHAEADDEKDRYITPQQSYETIRQQIADIYELDNPAEQMVEMHYLAIKTGWKVERLQEMYIADQEYLATEQQGEITLEDLQKMELEREYLIPGVIPKGFTTLVYGPGGEGKSSAVWAIAKHVASGSPFTVDGQLEPVKKGPVLIFNGDQPLPQLQEQLSEIDIPQEDMRNVIIRNGFDLAQQGLFLNLMEKYKPSLVVIDSLTACSGSRAADENKSIYATPLYWLTRNNGRLFHSTSIMIIHHANRQGGFRGSSSIRDSVDEVWSLRKLNEEERNAEISRNNSLPERSRVVTVEKSRQGRENKTLWLHKGLDETFSIEERAKELQKGDSKDERSQEEKAHDFLRQNRGEAFTLKQICKGALGGDHSAFLPGIKTAVRRLCKKGLVEKAGTSGKSHLYRTPLLNTDVYVRGATQKLDTLNQEPLQEKGSGCVSGRVSASVSNPVDTLEITEKPVSQPSQPLGQPSVSTSSDTLLDTLRDTLKDPSDTNGSDPSVSKVPRIPARLQPGPGMWNVS